MARTIIRLDTVTVTDPAEWGTALTNAYAAVVSIVGDEDVTPAEYQGGALGEEWRLHGHTSDGALTVYVPLVQSYMTGLPTLTALLTTPLNSEGEAVQLIRDMHGIGYGCHPDDSGASIVNTATGDRTFTDAQAVQYDVRMDEVFALVADPYAVGLEIVDNEPAEDYRGTHAATYHGITYARCLTCGRESRDADTLELWNDYGVACLTNGCEGASEWHLTDGTVTIVPADTDD
jgi:hypothetical protein